MTNGFVVWYFFSSLSQLYENEAKQRRVDMMYVEVQVELRMAVSNLSIYMYLSIFL